MPELRYTKDHTWIREEGNTLRVGLSDFAQAELGEIAFVELPEAGRIVAQGDPVCSIDSLKSTSEIYAPLTGRVVEVNEQLRTEGGCARIDSDPLGDGWLFVLELERPEELAGLLSAEEYGRYLAAGG